MTSRRTTLKALAASAASLATGSVLAQDDKGPITVLVGAASSMDYTARLIADQLRESLGRTAVVLSKLGAGQRVALGEARRAAPDGRTLVYVTSGPFAIYPHIYTKLDYDPDNDFTPIAGISTFDVAIATGPMTGATDMKSLVAWVKSQSNETVFGSAPGNGSLSHFVGIATALSSGMKLTHVPYKDSGVGIIDCAAGRLPIMVTGLAPLVDMHKQGRVRLIAVSGETRSPLVPEVPTLREAGVNFSATTSTGLFGPAKMAPDLVMRIHDAVQPMLTSAVIKEKLVQQSMNIWQATPQQLASRLVEERTRLGALVKASGYQPEAA